MRGSAAPRFLATAGACAIRRRQKTEQCDSSATQDRSRSGECSVYDLTGSGPPTLTDGFASTKTDDRDTDIEYDDCHDFDIEEEWCETNQEDGIADE